MNTVARADRSPMGTLVRLAVAVVPVAATSVLGTLATIPNIPTWYAALAKPPLTPPNGVFGPTWTALYAAMAFAVFRVLSQPDGPERSRALAWFFVQLALNALWSWAFFAAHSPALGLAVILPLLVAITGTIVAFAALDRIAAGLLVPYLAWVSFATYLNAGVFWLNR